MSADTMHEARKGETCWGDSFYRLQALSFTSRLSSRRWLGVFLHRPYLLLPGFSGRWLGVFLHHGDVDRASRTNKEHNIHTTIKQDLPQQHTYNNELTSNSQQDLPQQHTYNNELTSNSRQDLPQQHTYNNELTSNSQQDLPQQHLYIQQSTYLQQPTRYTTSTHPTNREAAGVQVLVIGELRKEILAHII